MNGLGYGMHNGYGMTETGILSVELSRRAKWRLSGGVGQPLQALSGGWRIAEDGVLELRSPLLYTAMLENGVRVPRDPEAWFRTRDVFRAEGGRWYMEARQGDLIIGANGAKSQSGSDRAAPCPAGRDGQLCARHGAGGR